MIDFEVQRCTRRCAVTDRELKPGEVFYSVLVAEGSGIQRRDYSEKSWEEPPENAVGWWKSQMPDQDANKLTWAPNDVILHYFEQLRNDPTRQDVRYILGLLMVRRRIMRLEDTETDEQGHELLVLFCQKDEQEYKIPVVNPGSERIEQIQEELAKLLFAKAASR